MNMRGFVNKWMRFLTEERGAIATSTLDLAAATAGAILLTLSFIPVVTGVTEEAKVAKAKAETGSFGEAISRFNNDTTLFPARSADGQDNTLELLISLRARAPELARGPGVFDPPTTRNPLPGAATGWTAFLGGANIDAIANHLVEDGDPGDAASGRPAEGAGRYRNPTGAQPVPWKGAYITNVGSDPWGRNYLILVRAYYDSTTGVAVVGQRLQGWIISAGPNGTLETDATSIALNNNPAVALPESRQRDDIGVPFFSAPQR